MRLCITTKELVAFLSPMGLFASLSTATIPANFLLLFNLLRTRQKHTWVQPPVLAVAKPRHLPSKRGTCFMRLDHLCHFFGPP